MRPSIGKRQGPCRKTARAKVELQSQASSYGGRSNAEGQRNTAEGQAATDSERKGPSASAPKPDKTEHRAVSNRGSKYSEGEYGDSPKL